MFKQLIIGISAFMILGTNVAKATLADDINRCYSTYWTTQMNVCKENLSGSCEAEAKIALNKCIDEAKAKDAVLHGHPANGGHGSGDHHR